MKSTSGAGQLLDELQALIRSAQMLLEPAASNEPQTPAADPEHGAEELLERLHQVRAGGERYVREHPLTALGLAAALGFLVGMALVRRRGPDGPSPERGD
jgi:ElaB/YqjD/DUF883 family membrane-anchored ribosome-binding protein